jgi:primosomal protein N' (replication factor Y)
VPPDNLGLIIIDHEEDRSQINYDQKPKYAIVDIAQKKINSNKSIKLLLTSPAPSITAYHHFKHYNLHCNQFIKAHLINLKEERLNGNYALFTEQLIDSIKKNRRSLLIYNKKGDVRLLLCQNCKEVVPSSIVSCPFCHSLNFKNISYGIKKLKKDLEKIFSDKKIIAIEKNGVEKDINNNWDIAIGTEYALRIIDINMVNFIALISVDHQLAVPDYQASERVWQLIRKIINFNKKCSIQTNSMNNIVIQSAINNDYLSFYHHELATRKKFHYPPFDKNDTNSV